MWNTVIAALIAISGNVLAAGITGLGGMPSPGEQSQYFKTFLFAGVWAGLPLWFGAIAVVGLAAPRLKVKLGRTLAIALLAICAMRFITFTPLSSWPLNTLATTALGFFAAIIWRRGLWVESSHV